MGAASQPLALLQPPPSHVQRARTRPSRIGGYSTPTAARATAPAAPTVSADDGGNGAGDGVGNGIGVEGVAAVVGAAVSGGGFGRRSLRARKQQQSYKRSSSGEFEAGDGTPAPVS